MEMQVTSFFFLQYLDELRKLLLFDQLNLELFVATVKTEGFLETQKQVGNTNVFRVFLFSFFFFIQVGEILKRFYV